jgi:glycosyltransferase involved in cell wall biosynthesis
MTSFPVVDVLLSTFNGEKYIDGLLESLAQQENVFINLLVHDDGSIDSTVERVLNHKSRFNSLQIFSEGHFGPAKSFLFLNEKASMEFVAFCDQDDLWKPQHLINSIQRLNNSVDLPSATFCSVEEFGKFSKKRVWPKKIKIYGVRQLLFQNYARGCTIVINRTMSDYLKQLSFKGVMHDWWVALIALSCGKLTWESHPEIEYRIHENNTIGPERSLVHKFNKNILVNLDQSWPPLEQLVALTELCANDLNTSSKNELSKWVSAITNENRISLVMMSLSFGRIRANIIDEFLIRLYLVLIAIKKER